MTDQTVMTIVAILILIATPICVFIIYRARKVYFFTAGFTAFLVLMLIVNSIAVLAVAGSTLQSTTATCSVDVCGSGVGMKKCQITYTDSWYTEFQCLCMPEYKTSNSNCSASAPYTGSEIEGCEYCDESKNISTSTTGTITTPVLCICLNGTPATDCTDPSEDPDRCKKCEPCFDLSGDKKSCDPIPECNGPPIEKDDCCPIN